MVNSDEDSKIIKPFMPSLFHIVSVEIAVSLLNEFDVEILKEIYKEIQCVMDGGERAENYMTDEGTKEENYATHYRANRKFLVIPAHLRKGVFEAIIGVHTSLARWRSKDILFWKYDYPIFVSPDGTVNAIKTTQQIVLDEKFFIRLRFHIASIYCLEQNILTLWSEMVASRDAENFDVRRNPMARFWVDRMRNGSQDPWPQAVIQFIESEPLLGIVPMCSSYFPSAHPRDRQKCFNYLQNADSDDLRFCIYSMTKAEEEQILKNNAYEVLLLYLEWPLRSLFLETVEKMWHYFDVECVNRIGVYFISCMQEKVEFDYLELFEGFLSRMPNELMKLLEANPLWQRCIMERLNEIKMKRKVANDERRRHKKPRNI